MALGGGPYESLRSAALLGPPGANRTVAATSALSSTISKPEAILSITSICTSALSSRHVHQISKCAWSRFPGSPSFSASSQQKFSFPQQPFHCEYGVALFSLRPESTCPAGPVLPPRHYYFFP